MRLSKIKLSGFKSFVDPTTFEFPSNLIGVVGPNGCGKSNTIDAVRWVMGESSARYLRGTSMEDVIFTGSATRQPVAQAFAELIFDNSDQTVGGEYAKYSEISVKRLITRDGQSKYFLNGSRCRRRDITDIFLGTGLGPRSYAIIEQGMISRLVESRPEELRVYLEEAAGISKYKERRRETENRIKHTRENLERLDDLRDEIQKQLEKLHRQSEVAKRYKEYKKTERENVFELQIFNWKQLEDEYIAIQNKQREQETKLEKTLSEQRSIENELEKQRDSFVASNDKINEVQGAFYKIGSELSAIEQKIQHNKENAQRQAQELKQNEQAIVQAQEHLQQDTQAGSQYTKQLAEHVPSFDLLAEQEQQQSATVEQHQQAINQWQDNWHKHQQEIREPSETAQVERTKIEQIERLVVQNEQRIKRYQQELELIGQEDIWERIEALEETEITLTEQQQKIDLQLKQNKTGLETEKTKTVELEEKQNQYRTEKQSLAGRIASINALQEAAKVDHSKNVLDYMQQHNIVFDSLMNKIQVNEGWEQALEMVLGQTMSALCVDSLDVLDKANLPAGLHILEKNQQVGQVDGLVAQIQCEYDLSSWLAGIELAETLDDALNKRAKLSSTQSIITKDAIWIGKTWIKMPQKAQQNDSFLKHEKLLIVEKKRLADVSELLDDCQQALAQHKQGLKESDQLLQKSQHSANQIHREKSQHSSQLHALKSRAKQVAQRKETLAKDIEELKKSIQDENQALVNATKKRNQALEDMSHISEKTEELNQKKDTIQQQLGSARQELENTKRQKQSLEIQIETIKTKQQSLLANTARMEQQLSHLKQRQDHLIEDSNTNQNPITELEEQLQQGIKKRNFIEIDLVDARKVAEQIDQQIRENEHQRVQREQQVQQIREQHEKTMMQGQERLTKKESLQEQIDESGFNKDEVVEALGEHITLTQLEQKLAQIRTRIERLGAINLAAIDEYQEEGKRKVYLDEQHADITEALTTLEKAIHKIDQETKVKFKETYDKVNNTLQELFPRLFGGGRAYLELTGDDLLDTGVSIMARPPGKKVSSIQLLSGGEKAMTAVALIFSFFELNPAPFCMLDEVDAPLDDANVGRFCEMVKEMSDRVQFIFITHNKVTMELSNQLVGVTMQEPGVSRMVSVDLSEAEKMVGAQN